VVKFLLMLYPESLVYKEILASRQSPGNTVKVQDKPWH
jgi:hypothetical protein